MKQLLDFAILARGLSPKDKVKLVLFALRLKPAASIYLRISPENLDEAYAFEHALRMSKIVYCRGREKSYEEVRKIAGNKVVWGLAGLWIDYDLFHTLEQRKKFLEYKRLWEYQRDEKRRNRIAGELYGYPSCCIATYGKKPRNPYAFYKQLHAIDATFPLLPYMPCKLTCPKSIALSKTFAQAIKKASPSFWDHLQEVETYKTEVIIDSRNMESKQGYDYVVLATTPFRGKYWFYTVLSQKKYAVGTVLTATIRHHPTYADVRLGAEKRKIKNFYHERMLPLLKREY
ncbi:hypothetical protein HY639_00015 [Candidatus Woesearchaeota archaeon]|nr:hypothetical protein [Candidatus Woesearchaeota archaeon]